MVEEKKEEVKLLKLDLACGQNKQKDFTGVDKHKCEGVDIVFDLETYPWTFAQDDSVDEVFISHYIEHVTDLVKFMDELYRIMKVGAKCMIIAPYYNSIRCWQDPTHKRAISEATMLYFNAEWRKHNKIDHYGSKADFDYTYGYSVYPNWAMKNEEARNFAITHYMNVVSDIQFVLTKREKDGKK